MPGTIRRFLSHDQNDYEVQIKYTLCRQLSTHKQNVVPVQDWPCTSLLQNA